MSVSRKKGFTLVEVSIVMLIGALLTFSGVKGVSYFRESYNKKITEHRLDEIEKALLLYLQSKRSMPCPASLVAEVNSVNFGKAMKYDYTIGTETYQMCGVSAADIGDLIVGTQGQYSSCSVGSGYGSTYPMSAVDTNSNNVLCSVPVYGAVPVADLGLPNEYAFDANNNRIAYVIGTGAVQKPLLNSDNSYRKQNFCAENHVGKKHCTFYYTDLGVSIRYNTSNMNILPFFLLISPYKNPKSDNHLYGRYFYNYYGKKLPHGTPANTYEIACLSGTCGQYNLTNIIELYDNVSARYPTKELFLARCNREMEKGCLDLDL